MTIWRAFFRWGWRGCTRWAVADRPGPRGHRRGLRPERTGNRESGRAALDGATAGADPRTLVDAAATSPVVSSGGLFDIGLRPLDREQPFFGEPSLRGDLRALWISSLSGSTRLNATGLADALAPAGPLSLSLAFCARARPGRRCTCFPATRRIHRWSRRARRRLWFLGCLCAPRPCRAACQQPVPLHQSSRCAGCRTPLRDIRISLGFALAGAVAPASGRFADGDFGTPRSLHLVELREARRRWRGCPQPATAFWPSLPPAWAGR